MQELTDALTIALHKGLCVKALLNEGSEYGTPEHYERSKAGWTDDPDEWPDNNPWPAWRERMTEALPAFLYAIDEAVTSAPSAASVMDGSEPPPQRWTVGLVRDLQAAAALFATILPSDPKVREAVGDQWVHGMRRCSQDEVFVKALIERLTPLAKRLDDLRAVGAAQGATKPKIRMSLEEANKIADRMYDSDPDRWRAAVAREWKTEIGCSLGLVTKLNAWGRAGKTRTGASAGSRSVESQSSGRPIFNPDQLAPDDVALANLHIQGRLEDESTTAKERAALNALITDQAKVWFINLDEQDEREYLATFTSNDLYSKKEHSKP